MELHGFAHPGPITPVALMGQNVVIVHDGKYHLYRALLLEGITQSNPLVFDGGALAAAASANNQSLGPVIDMPMGNFFQFRFRVLDDIRVTLDQPQRLGTQVLSFQAAEVSAYTSLYDPCSHQTERAIYWDRRPFLNITNPTDYAIAQSRVLFWGFKFMVDLMRTFDDMEALLVSGEKFTAIMSQGVFTAPTRPQVARMPQAV